MGDKKYYERDKQTGKLAVYRANRRRVVAERKERFLSGTETEEDRAAVEKERATKAKKAKALAERLSNGTASVAEVAAHERRQQRQREWTALHKDHVISRSKEWKKKNPDKVKESNARWRREHAQEMKARKKAWIEANPEEHTARRLRRLDRLRSNPAKFLLRTLGSKAIGLSVEDLRVPDTCPLLGVPLVISPAGVGATNYSPSVDRIDSTRGYTKDNVWVISKLANTMKNCATKEELRTFCNNALRLLTDGCLANMPEKGEQSA